MSNAQALHDRLHLAPEVVQRLDAGTLARLYALREHSELHCIGCGETILPESKARVEVVLTVEPTTGSAPGEFRPRPVPSL